MDRTFLREQARCHTPICFHPMGSASRVQRSSTAQPVSRVAAESVCLRFWMNGCSQVVHVSASSASRYRRDLLATGAVLLN